MLQTLLCAVYPVRDLAAAKAWYAKALKMSPCFESPTYIGFQPSTEGAELGLIPQEPGAEPGPVGCRSYWKVASLDTALTHWLACGAQQHEAVDSCEGMRHVCVRDPDGNLLGLIERATD